jgi:hypothetical protein
MTPKILKFVTGRDRTAHHVLPPRRLRCGGHRCLQRAIACRVRPDP